MSGWDWYFVAELALGLFIGIAAGAWFAVDRLEVMAMRVLTNPSVRKLANAADRFSGNQQGGIVEQVIGGALQLFTGGRGLGGGMGGNKAFMMDADGKLVGEVMLDARGRPIEK